MQISERGRYFCPSWLTARQTKMPSPRPIFMAVLSLIALVGCGSTKSGPATVEVTGTVTLDGTAIDGASVLFSPDVGSGDGRLASQATTDNEGRFKLTTHVGGGKFKSGIVPGKYVVSIMKLDNTTAKNTYTPQKNLLPSKYADPQKSQLTADVAAAQANDFQFPLKNK